MSDTTIEWTEKTWNPVTGCSKVSAGCKNCYAETVALRFWATQYQPVPIAFGHDGEVSASRPRVFTDVQTHDDRLDQPLHWKKPRRVFVNSMSDLFHEDVPDAFILDVFRVMERCPQHTFQVLTKRPARMLDVLGGTSGAGLSATPLPNVWLGVSVENQHFADKRIPLLLQTPAAVRFISAEPLLGPVDLAGFVPRLTAWKPYVECRHGFDCCPICDFAGGTRLDWVIVGGESGAGARPCALEWLESLQHQCATAGVAFFLKQLGAYVVSTERTDDDGRWAWQMGLRDPKGGDMSEWPESMRVRQLPEARS